MSKELTYYFTFDRATAEQYVGQDGYKVWFLRSTKSSEDWVEATALGVDEDPPAAVIATLDGPPLKSAVLLGAYAAKDPFPLPPPPPRRLSADLLNRDDWANALVEEFRRRGPRGGFEF